MTNYDEIRSQQLETIGHIHLGLSVLMLRLDSPKCCCARLKRALFSGSPLLDQPILEAPKTVDIFADEVLPMFVLA
ncbi:hypothetical protein DFQ28_010592 [Apophysomyces sp. BC1034]|nr:hypothetical protein DFQ30_005352 [Apophysomyces sp. BC1015]KAG0183489.1 hypothetical protein DFQ29_002543 [Apophysomyces sp. BC1021]KAG0194508.1 hypothetical protein DFQ28_010592 [Apophysomyces sp. BC1034]